jgi:regulator of protease activity HflC (stomatin/prohibitin superfamily)
MVLALALMGLVVGVVGLAIMLTMSRQRSRTFWLASDMITIVLAVAAVLVIGVVVAATVPGGPIVFALLLFVVAIGLKVGVRYETLALKEYAFVQSGRTLIDTWHHDRGASFIALKSTKIVKSTLGFQGAAFPASEPVRVISKDGIEIWVDLGLGYMINPDVNDDKTEQQLADEWAARNFRGAFELWRMGAAEGVRDTLVKPQLGQAARKIFGQYPALEAVSHMRDQVRKDIMKELRETLPPQGINPLGVTLGGAFPDPDISKAWMELALMNIDPAFSQHKLEEMRISSVSQAGAIVIPADTALHVTLPGRTPKVDQSV